MWTHAVLLLLHTIHTWVCCGRRCKGSITSCNVQTSRQHWWVGGPPTHVSGRFFPMLPGWGRPEDDDQALRCLALAVKNRILSRDCDNFLYFTLCTTLLMAVFFYPNLLRFFCEYYWTVTTQFSWDEQILGQFFKQLYIWVINSSLQNNWQLLNSYILYLCWSYLRIIFSCWTCLFRGVNTVMQ